MKRQLWIAGAAGFAMVATAVGCVQNPAVNPPACAALDDGQAVAYAREVFGRKSSRQLEAPVWQGRNPVKLDVLAINRDSPNATAVTFGQDGQSRITAMIYSDCEVGWTH